MWSSRKPRGRFDGTCPDNLGAGCFRRLGGEGDSRGLRARGDSSGDGRVRASEGPGGVAVDEVSLFPLRLVGTNRGGGCLHGGVESRGGASDKLGFNNRGLGNGDAGPGNGKYCGLADGGAYGDRNLVDNDDGLDGDVLDDRADGFMAGPGAARKEGKAGDGKDMHPRQLLNEGTNKRMRWQY